MNENDDIFANFILLFLMQDKGREKVCSLRFPLHVIDKQSWHAF